MSMDELSTWSLSQPDAPLTDADLLAMNNHLRTVGPVNCWTNASDEIARRLMIELLRERNKA